jgi:hypothetical protein
MALLPQLSILVGDCLDQGLLAPLTADVYATPSTLQRANKLRKGASSPIAAHNEFFIGTYESLGNFKNLVGQYDMHGRDNGGGGGRPGMWSDTEIHHIVEHYHLQYLSRHVRIGEASYAQQEPCVVLATPTHKLEFENLIGMAEQVILETKSFSMLKEFAKHQKSSLPNWKTLSKDAQAVEKRRWTGEVISKGLITPSEIKRCIEQIYSFAYQLPEHRALKLIAMSVIREMGM